MAGAAASNLRSPALDNWSMESGFVCFDQERESWRWAVTGLGTAGEVQLLRDLKTREINK